MRRAWPEIAGVDRIRHPHQPRFFDPHLQGFLRHPGIQNQDPADPPAEKPQLQTAYPGVPHSHHQAAAREFHHNGLSQQPRNRQSSRQVQSLHQEIDDIVVPAFFEKSPGNSQCVDHIPPAPRFPVAMHPYPEPTRVYPFAHRRHRITARAHNSGPVAALLQFVGDPLGLNLGSAQHRRIGVADQHVRDREVNHLRPQNNMHPRLY